MDLLDTIKKRYSPRAFCDKPVERSKMEALFQAARWAPSSFNAQPWRFVVATRESVELWNYLFDSLSEFNKNWVVTAPVLILTLVRKNYEHNEKPYKHNWHDLGLAVGNMLNQAMYMDLYMHQMGGFDSDIVSKNIGLPDTYEAVSMIALGYRQDLSVLSDELRDRELQPRSRKNIDDIVFDKPFE